MIDGFAETLLARNLLHLGYLGMIFGMGTLIGEVRCTRSE
jgi:hypothetical protein